MKRKYKLLDEAFELVANKFNEEGIKWFLIWGSLLGCVREGKRIEWDHDYDIGYDIKDAMKVRKSLLEIEGIKFGGNLGFSVWIEDGLQVSIHPYKKKGEKMVVAIENRFLRCINAGNFFIFPFIHSLPLKIQELLIEVNKKTNSIKCYDGYFDWYNSFVTKKMNDISCPIPIGYKELLKETYGDDYMVPKKDTSTCYKGGIGPEEWVKKHQE
jgi:hypothetical protein